MTFIRGNRAIRDHVQDSKTIHLFEYVRDGFVKYLDEMVYIGYNERIAQDIDKKDRKVIVFELIRKGTLQNSSGLEEDEPNESLEERKKLRNHKFIERNDKLSKRAKEIHGYICMACGFNFENKYGIIGKNYIEAHHLIPFAQLEENTKLSPKNDFAVLCANCHRIIHKFKNTSSIEEFKKIISF